MSETTLSAVGSFGGSSGDAHVTIFLVPTPPSTQFTQVEADLRDFGVPIMPSRAVWSGTDTTIKVVLVGWKVTVTFSVPQNSINPDGSGYGFDLSLTFAGSVSVS